MRLQIRPAQPSEVDAIFAMDRATEYASHWPLSTYLAILGGVDTSRCVMVAHGGGAVVGFAVGLVSPGNPKTGELESIVVAESARRGGIGRALCVAVIDWCRSDGATEVVLEVRSASVGAIALYAGLGFRETGRRPRYYLKPSDDAVLMRLPIGLPGNS